jgi:hypothetical protein
MTVDELESHGLVGMDDAEIPKAALTDEGTAARFLVYRVDTAFDWESALLTGAIREGDGPTPPADDPTAEVKSCGPITVQSGGLQPKRWGQVRPGASYGLV